MVGLQAHSQRMVLLAEGRLSSIGLRMVIAALLYVPDRIIAVIDSTKERQTAQEGIGFGGDTPIVHSLEEAMEYEPDSILIGITPLGGRIPDTWREIIVNAMDTGLHVVSGLQQILMKDELIRAKSAEKGVQVYDLKTVPHSHLIRAQGSWQLRAAKTILTVGTDANTGKMTAAIRIYEELKARGKKVALIGTGPTGILISGRGVTVESIGADFVTGAIEYEIDKAINEGYDHIVVEGQGAITHCGNSPVSLGILHGTMPDAMILCHHAAREKDIYGLKLPTVAQSIALHEHIMAPFKASKVVGIALNTMDLGKDEVAKLTETLQSELQLNAIDPMRHSAKLLVDDLERYYETYKNDNRGQQFIKVYDRIF